MHPSIARTLAPILVLLYAQAASAAVGRTPGSFAVSSSGAGTYTLPLWAPPGPHELQPHLSLVYNSHAGEGYLGVGWSIAGLSQITRCNDTYAQDTAPAAVTLTYADRFCLDGNRLRLTSSENLSTYGQSGTTYQTEIANFANVTAEGVTGSGPSYFEVQGKDGKTYEYGNGGNSQIVLSSTAATWLLDKVTDRAGNTMTIAYVCATGQSCSNPSSALVGTIVPATISWTPSSHGSSSYNYTMTFSYQPTAAALAAGYVAGNQAELSDLLFGIDIQSSGTTVKNYVFAYSTSPTTNRLTLSSVQECADAAASNCLLPTSLQYQSGTAGVANPTTASASGATNGHFNAVDLNGDGRADLVFATTNGSGNYQWWVQFATASGYGAPVNTGAITPAGTSVLLDDFDASGTNEILAPNGSTWFAYKWNGSTFVATSTGIAVVSGAVYSSADVNGDGLPDLVYVYANFDFNLHVQLNTTSGSAISFASTAVVSSIPGEPSCDPPYQPCPTYPALQLMGNNQMPNSAVKSFDFDGDGRQDLILTYTSTFNGSTSYEIITLLSRGTGPFVEGTVNGNGLGQEPVLAANWNDDACTDLVIGTTLLLSQCNGSVATLVTLPNSPFLALDWDGDGLTDLIVSSGGNYYLYHSTASSYSDSLIDSFSVGSGPVLVMDQNGDGLSDIALASSSASYALYYGLHNGAGQPPDLLTSATDGYGNSVSTSYVSLAQSNYTNYTDASYPEQNYIGPLYVVNEAVYSDPTSASGGTYNQQFWYSGAWTNLQGRGFDAFYAIRTMDSRMGLYDYTYYQRSFPSRGLMNRHDHLQSDNATEIRQLLNTISTTTLDGTADNQRYFSFVSNATRYDNEVAGSSEDGERVNTTVTNYNYDNYGNATTVARTVTDNDPGSPYNGQSWTTTTTNTTDVDTATWCLNLFTETQIAYTASNGSTPVTRTKSFTPDLTNCRYTQVVTEPSSANYKVTEAYGFDAFGNVNSDTVTGIGMAARTTTTNWGTTGQLPLTATNPSGAQTQFNYNFGFGVISSVTDANNETTSWQYTDGFGRKTEEIRPDGTKTYWTYSDCGALSECFLGSHALITTYDIYNSDGSLQTAGDVYYDQVDRPLITNKLLLSGAYDRNELRYDNLGNIHEVYAPCIWSSISTVCPYVATYTHDALNRVTQVQRPVGASNPSVQTTTYDYAGRTSTVIDPYGQTTSTVEDVNGWLRVSKDALGYAVTIACDAAGSQTGITDSAGATLLKNVSYAYGIRPSAGSPACARVSGPTPRPAPPQATRRVRAMIRSPGSRSAPSLSRAIAR